MQKGTPMLRQYLELKKQYPGTLLFFRLGDFYELFNEDAIIGARELEITLTARQKKSANPIPMCGVPHQSAAGYISKLVRKGYRVAICEQTENADKTKKLVKREVVRIITPGTAIDEQLLEKKKPVYLASLAGAEESFGIAYMELSTGEFFTTELTGSDAWTKTCADINSFAPRELLFPESLKALVTNSFHNSSSGNSDAMSVESSLLKKDQASSKLSTTLTQLNNNKYDIKTCELFLKNQFETQTLTPYGLDKKTNSVAASGACLQYAKETQRATAKHISEIKFFDVADFMTLDAITLKNLEIVESNRTDRSNKRSLLGVIDKTVTGMGGRLLRSWLLRPSVKRSEIQTRLLAVSELTESILRDRIRFLLKEISDLERLVGRLNLGTATPRDLLALKNSLSTIPKLNSSLSKVKSVLLKVLSENIFEMPNIQALISKSIADEPPLNINNGGVIRKGFHDELDELRKISKNTKQTIASFEERERKRTGINSLHIKFNKVFGYFIEISKANLSLTPEDYERRQTLTNAERFTTPELKNWENKVLGAEERIKNLEAELFKEIRSKVQNETKKLQSTARALAALDSLASLAEIAAHNDFVQPDLHDGDLIDICDGRHPIVEAFSDTPFIPNSLKLNNSTNRLLIITGANMGGKSTVLRQIALIQILAQIGSFVPASSAKLPILDRIWTRVGASDDLSSGRSTFMVEMTETATILHNATPKSLILLDEIGRGTSTFDGLAIAWAVAEYLHNSPKHSAKTLFATHYHELTELAEKLPGAKNYQITAKEQDGEIIFLHKLEKGKASKSYGIAVAKLAGLPTKVVVRAQEVLKKLEQYEIAVFSDKQINSQAKGLEAAVERASKSRAASQASLFAIVNEDVINEIRGLNTSDITPEESKKLLIDLKKRII